jgi:hypothetical protein
MSDLTMLSVGMIRTYEPMYALPAALRPGYGATARRALEWAVVAFGASGGAVGLLTIAGLI